jgi:hypothetical protein
MAPKLSVSARAFAELPGLITVMDGLPQAQERSNLRLP